MAPEIFFLGPGVSISKYFHNTNEEKKTSKFALIMILYAVFSVSQTRTLSVPTVRCQ